MPFSKTDFYFNKTIADFYGEDINDYDEQSTMYMGHDGYDMLYDRYREWLMKVLIATGCPTIQSAIEKYPFIEKDTTFDDISSEEEKDEKEREQKKAKKSVIGAVMGFHESLKPNMGVIRKNEPNPDSCITHFPWVLECASCHYVHPVSDLGFCGVQCEGCHITINNPEHVGSECATHNTCFYPKKFQGNHKKCK
jgi:hypothetical protein